MPYLPDKVEMNTWGFSADAYSMEEALGAAKYLGDEMIEIGKLKDPASGGIINNQLLKEDAVLHLQEQEDICAELHKTLGVLIQRQRGLNEKRRKWLDTQL